MAVNGSGDQLLAGSALASDQDRGRGGCDLGNEFRNLLHLRIVADNKFTFGARFQLPESKLILIFQAFGLVPRIDKFPDKSRSIATNDFCLSGL